MHVGVDLGSQPVRTATRDATGAVSTTSGPARADTELSVMVAAVPDAWLAGDLAGARRGEAARRALEHEWAALVQRTVGRAQAAVAGATTTPDGQYAVCDIASTTVSVVICRREADTVTVLGAEVVDATVEDLAAVLGQATPAEQRRAAVVIPAAAQLSRYRTTVLYGRVVAGDLLDGFAPVCAAIAGLRATGPALILGPPIDGHALDAVAALLGVPAALALPDDVVCEGALAIAEGRVRVADTSPATLALPAHRVLAGQLVDETISLAQQGRPLAGWVLSQQGPLTVEVRPGDELPLLWRGQPLPLSTVPAGLYQFGFWPSHHGPGLLILRPSPRGEPVLVSLDITSGGAR
ncbi:hypothetical protein AB0B66_34015 [Catellatospora sp. NPDC049111]|uniref:hypothetical protein n=1 Tax=Catellatospora sp. NPDC049111 TaxID=3155271 RepID=UPI0033EF14DC